MRTAFLAPFAAAAAMLVSATSAEALALRSGFEGYSLAAEDDASEGPFALGFDVNFFGVDRSSIWVNTNGNITLDGEMTSYTPFDLTSTAQQIIAPFFGDVDITLGGSIGHGAGTVDGYAAYGVTWRDVQVFGGSTDDKLNTFQVVLVDRSDTGAGNFDIEFNYDRIEWEAGSFSGGENGLGGSSARAGYSNGTGAAGTYFELAGSAVNGAFLAGGAYDLAANSLGSDVAGRYVFTGRAGAIEAPEQVLVPSTVPVPAALPLMAAGLAAFAWVGRSRRAA